MIVEIKRRNPNFGYQRIADQISLVFNIQIDKNTVQRVLASPLSEEEVVRTVESIMRTHEQHAQSET